MDKMEKSTRNVKSVDYRKCRGDSGPGHIGVARGDPNMDDRKSQGDSDPDRICVSGGDLEFSCVTGGVLTLKDIS